LAPENVRKRKENNLVVFPYLLFGLETSKRRPLTLSLATTAPPRFSLHVFHFENTRFCPSYLSYLIVSKKNFPGWIIALAGMVLLQPSVASREEEMKN
jgi:hypothetical protein